jgi:hypothetical protein
LHRRDELPRWQSPIDINRNLRGRNSLIGCNIHFHRLQFGKGNSGEDRKAVGERLQIFADMRKFFDSENRLD